MRCHICDKMLSDAELNWNKDLGAWEPCAKCLEVALDAAYSGGFTRGDDEEVSEVEDEFGSGEIETLDPDSRFDDDSERQLDFSFSVVSNHEEDSYD